VASFSSADGTSFPLVDGVNLIGRGGREFNGVPVVDVSPIPNATTVSHRHARVYLEGKQWYLKIEEARTPTRVAGREIQRGEEVPLTDGMPVQVGEIYLTFRGPTAPPVTPSVPLVDTNATTTSEPARQPDLPPAAPPIRLAPPAHVEVTPPTTWPSRLPARPDALAALGVSEFKRVNPFRGLMIDEAAWADAHDYHRLLAQLHLLAGHGWGVVEGLDVVADESGSNALIIRPGIAVDFQGHALIINQERRLPIGAGDGITLYVIARLREEPAAPQRFWNDLDEYTRVIERCETNVVTSKPGAQALELARLMVSGPIRNAPDPRYPASGEIDLRFRERLAVRPQSELVVAQLTIEGAPAPAESHRLGLQYLLREIAQTTSYRARWAGEIRLGNTLPAVSLLYLTGTRAFAIGDAVAEQLRGFLDGGGVLFADGCREGGDATEFATVVEGLAHGLGRQFEPVGRAHRLLNARHVFAAPPLPVTRGPVLSDANGIVLTTADYGCAWAGGPADQPLPRESVRAALELGVNAAVHARQRQRPLEALELG
jgi:hypothetical protein